MAEPAATIRALAPATRFILQGAAAVRAAAGPAFGVALPDQACRAHAQGGRAALWLGPDEWLLLAPAGEELAIQAALEDALAALPHSLVDVTHRQVALAVNGPRARDLLASGCALDLDAEAYPVNSCTRTLLAKAEVVVWRQSAEEYHLEVGRSFAGYVLGWLRETERCG
jgi:sarcosine oxidase, subunit gamma